MSTRTSVLIKDGKKEKWFYHHTNGSPTFIGLTIATNLHYHKGIEGGWSVDRLSEILDEQIYHPVTGYKTKFVENFDIQGDEDYIYVIDCKRKTLSCYIHKINEDLFECMSNDRLVMFFSYPTRRMVDPEETLEESRDSFIESFYKFTETVKVALSELNSKIPIKE